MNKPYSFSDCPNIGALLQYFNDYIPERISLLNHVLHEIDLINREIADGASGKRLKELNANHKDMETFLNMRNVDMATWPQYISEHKSGKGGES